MKRVIIDLDDYTYDKISGDRSYDLLSMQDLGNLHNAFKKGLIVPSDHRIGDFDEALNCIKDAEGEDAIWAIGLIEWAMDKRSYILGGEKENERTK